MSYKAITNAPFNRGHESVNLGRVAIFALFLAPISIVIGGDGVSANYLFILLLLSAKGYRKNKAGMLYVIFMFISWLIGMMIFSKGDEFFILRQTVSFGIALAATFLLFVRLKTSIYEILLAAVVVATIYSCFAIAMIGLHGFSLSDIYFIKGGLREYVADWPQRFVVVLLFALFVSLERISSNLLWFFSFWVILLCIFLTFTRAAWIAVLFGLAAYFIATLIFKSRRIKVRGARKRRVIGTLLLILPIGILPVLFPDVVIALQRIWSATFDAFDILFSGGSFDTEGSEGTRLEIWSKIIDVLKVNPFTGSGFAGASLTLEGAGSAHSQYLDVLLRTGLLGLIFYFYFWGKAFRFYSRRSVGIFAGLIAIFVFGFFHETTKLSYGALILFSLLNKMYEEKKSIRMVVSSYPTKETTRNEF